jgi:diguanylate cyclase (GGDEF)-like protein
LTAIGRVFRRSLRAYDVGARFGGDEFVALMPGTDSKQAGAIAERLRDQVHALQLLELPGNHSMTFGVALWSTGESAPHFVARADAAMYRGKQAGRDRVEIDTTERLREDSDNVARTN